MVRFSLVAAQYIHRYRETEMIHFKISPDVNHQMPWVSCLIDNFPPFLILCFMELRPQRSVWLAPEPMHLPIDFRQELNDDQYAAVTAEPGPALVLAGAGSGKTRTLTYRVAYLLHQGLRPWQILLLTFTNKAAKEMLKRVQELTGDSFQGGWGGTFHSVAARILRLHGDKIGFRRDYTILDADDAEKLFESVIKEEDPKFFKSKETPKSGVIFDCISFSRNTCRPLADVIQERIPWLEDLCDRLEHFTSLYQKTKSEQQVMDYDDLLEYWLRLLREHEDVRTRFQEQFQHILVDEYQDTNQLQSEIVDTLGHRHQIMAVGDDAQCIYTWRGANFENIASFATRHPGTRIFKIEVNYRSTPEILALANRILIAQPAGSGFHKTLRAVRNSDCLPFVIPCLDSLQQANIVSRRIVALLEEGVPAQEIAVLYRAHYQSLDLQLELTKRGVVFVITSGAKFFDLAHIKDLIAQLRFLVNPLDFSAFARFCTLLPKIGEKAAARLHELAQKIAQRDHLSLPAALSQDDLVGKVPEAARETWEQLALTLAQADLAIHPVSPAKNSLADADLFTLAAQQQNAEIQPRSPREIVTMLIQGWYGHYLRNAYKDWEERHDDLDGLVSFAGRYEEMQDFLAQVSLLNGETNNHSTEDAANAVRLTTIHQAKGLEYRVVFLIGLAEGMFPLRRAIDSGDIDEERRLFYVGVTRARDELYLCYPKVAIIYGGVQQQGASRFLLELPTNTYKLVRNVV